MKFISLSTIVAAIAVHVHDAAGRRTGHYWHKEKDNWSDSWSIHKPVRVKKVTSDSWSIHKPVRVKKVTKVRYGGSKSGKSGKGSYGSHGVRGYGKSSKANWYESSKTKWHANTYDGWSSSVEGHRKKRKEHRRGYKRKLFVFPVFVRNVVFSYSSLLSYAINRYPCN